MSEDMVERIAAAMKNRAAQPLFNLPSLEPVLVGSLGDAWDVLARAAIEAMREPTDEMYGAGCQQISHFDGEYGDYNVEFSVQQIERLWPAMIDAALHNPEGKGKDNG